MKSPESLKTVIGFVNLSFELYESEARKYCKEIDKGQLTPTAKKRILGYIKRRVTHMEVLRELVARWVRETYGLNQDNWPKEILDYQLSLLNRAGAIADRYESLRYSSKRRK